LFIPGRRETGTVVLAYDDRLEHAVSERATQEKRSSTLLDEPVFCCGQWFYTFEGVRLHNEVKHKRTLTAAEEVAGGADEPSTRPAK
jgi:hypothetical protein